MSRAAYACHPERSLGRVVDEPGCPWRSPFQRDRDRILHAAAFRRLEGKTQVLVAFAGDHFRTRLTHSLEVAQISRTLARALGVDEDLAETLALAHDLGHSPFGHAGERALGRACAAAGGFDHNLQSFRVVTELERRYAGFDGLNLSLEVLEGLAKHHGPLPRPLPAPIAAHQLAARLDLAAQAPLEAQLAAIADDVAYSAHDLDDGLRAGFFGLGDLMAVPILAGLLAVVDRAWPDLEPRRRTHELGRRLVAAMVDDLLAETGQRVEAATPADAEAIRRLPQPLVRFSAGMAARVAELRAFLDAKMYRHWRIERAGRKAARVVEDLARTLIEAPECLPGPWRDAAEGGSVVKVTETVRDYIAGMTDRFALDEHDRLFRLGPAWPEPRP